MSITARRLTTGKKRAPRRPASIFGDLARVGESRNSVVGGFLAQPLADYQLVVGSVVLLVVMGVIMVTSASTVYAEVNQGNAYYYLLRQLAFLAVGVPIAWWLSRRSARALQIVGWVGIMVSILLLIAVFTPLGVDVYGNRAWLSLGGFGTIQPSEFAKFSLIVWSAAVWANRKNLCDMPKLLFPVLLGFGVVELLVILQHDLGTAVIIGIIMFSMLWFVGAPLRIIVGLGSLAVVGLAVGIVFDEERWMRIISFLGAGEGGSDQPLNAIYALASGGWFGLGLGRSRQKWGGLYNGAQTDYVLAVLGEEIGLIGILAVLALFAILAFAGLRIAARTQNSFMKYAAAGMTAWLIVQALVNICVVMRILPVLGVPLPFLSQGGSALLANLAAVGVLLAAARQEPAAAEYLAAAKKPTRITTIVGGTR